jgi:hypothetical protein
MVAETSSISGIVAAVNERGLRLSGEDDWRNFSKWSTVDTLPERGDAVALTLDRAGFVRQVQVVETEPGPAETPNVCETHSAVDRETRITRLACVNSAVAILTTRNARGGVEVDEVLALAARLEAWTLR